MIIDSHQHVVAPNNLEAYKGGLLSARGAHGKGSPGITVEMLAKATWQGTRTHIQILDEVGTDIALLSARPYTLMHSEKPEIIVRWFTEATNDVLAMAVKTAPERFQGVACLPQWHGAGTATYVQELKRCVNDLGFVGCMINPDPTEGEGITPPLGDEYWYPLYEKLVELDVPGMIHSSTCLSSRLSYTLHFINEESIAVVSVLNSQVFTDFPTLKLVVAHGGGAIPYQIGRFMAGRYPSRRNIAREAFPESEYFENVVRKLYYDTCLYTREGRELLFKVIGSAQCLFGTESPGAGSSVHPQTGKALDDIKPVIEGIEWLTASDRKKIFEENAKRLYRLRD